MKTVKASKLKTISMVQAGERDYPVVIHNGWVKEWVGIGWIKLHEATEEDKEKYPVVVDE